VYAIQLLTYPWWELGLLSLSVLFILLESLVTASVKGIGKSGLWSSGGFSSYGLNVSHVENRALLALKKPDAMFSERENDWISNWVTRLFIAIVLISATIYIVSQCPGFQSPFWLGFVLQGFTYGSAYLFYISGGDESTGH
jgi:hypothetical protein